MVDQEFQCVFPHHYCYALAKSLPDGFGNPVAKSILVAHNIATRNPVEVSVGMVDYALAENVIGVAKLLDPAVPLLETGFKSEIDEVVTRVSGSENLPSPLDTAMIFTRTLKYLNPDFFEKFVPKNIPDGVVPVRVRNLGDLLVEYGPIGVDYARLGREAEIQARAQYKSIEGTRENWLVSKMRFESLMDRIFKDKVHESKASTLLANIRDFFQQSGVVSFEKGLMRLEEYGFTVKMVSSCFARILYYDVKDISRSLSAPIADFEFMGNESRIQDLIDLINFIGCYMTESNLT